MAGNSVRGFHRHAQTGAFAISNDHTAISALCPASMIAARSLPDTA